jgi:endonuclease YncB( thermonuclease family)
VPIAIALNLGQLTSSEDLHGRVVSINDGVTLKILVGNQQVIIRLAGIDTPEHKQALSDKVFARSRLSILTATGALWAKSGVDSRDINREMVREGHAWVLGST